MVNDEFSSLYLLPLDDISLFGGLSSRGRSAGGGGSGPGGGGGRDSVVSDVGDSCSSLSSWPTPEHVPANRPGSGGTERRRRRLPEIPKSKKCKEKRGTYYFVYRQTLFRFFFCDGMVSVQCGSSATPLPLLFSHVVLSWTLGIYERNEIT